MNRELKKQMKSDLKIFLNGNRYKIFFITLTLFIILSVVYLNRYDYTESLAHSHCNAERFEWSKTREKIKEVLEK